MANKQVNIGAIRSQQSRLNKPGYLLFFMGQSNGDEWFIISGNISAGLQAVQHTTKIYYKSGAAYPNTEVGSFQSLQAGVNGRTGPATGKFSPGLLIADRLRNVYNKASYIIQTNIPNTSLALDVANSWNINETPLTGNWYHNAMINHFRMAYPDLAGMNIEPVCIWIHGENNADTPAHGASYQQDLIDLIAQTRIDSGFPNMKFVISKLKTEYSGNATAIASIRAAQVYVSENIDNVYLIDTDDNLRTPLSADNVHYSPQSPSFNGIMGIKNLGDDIADLISTF